MPSKKSPRIRRQGGEGTRRKRTVSRRKSPNVSWFREFFTVASMCIMVAHIGSASFDLHPGHGPPSYISYISLAVAISGFVLTAADSIPRIIAGFAAAISFPIAAGVKVGHLLNWIGTAAPRAKRAVYQWCKRAMTVQARLRQLGEDWLRGKR